MVHYYATLILRFDGACKGKKQQRREGVAGSGWLLCDGSTNEVIAQGYYYIGTRGTNNVAEYMGLLGGLKFIQNEGIQIGKKLHVQGDSELVIKHMKGEYTVRSKRLRPLWGHCKRIITDLGLTVDFKHIYREKNHEADYLAQKAIDHGSSSADWK